jgi:3-methyladenine DNA glycosylase Tag
MAGAIWRGTVTTSTPIALGTLATAYVKAKMKVLAAGYVHEIIWQKSLRTERLTERDLLKECAWVILSSGMRESVVRKKFSGISDAFFGWSSAEVIVYYRAHCVSSALVLFGHKGKIEAIAECARIIYEKGFESLRRELASDPIDALQQFPYIGPATSYHVAKNIGFPVAKPDRHLRRFAELSGYQSPSDLCKALADYIGDPIAVVDIVLWRFATLQHDYMTSFLRTGD